MQHITDLMNNAWSYFIEWNVCPILEFDLYGKIINGNLVARAQLSKFIHDNEHFLKNNLMQLSSLMHQDNSIVVYVQELKISHIVYDAYCLGVPEKGTIFVYMADITHQKKIEKELYNLNKELELRVVERTNELKIAKEKAEEMTLEAMEANKLKTNFLANMSHELRTPLNGIMGLAELMHSEVDGKVSAEHKEYLADILSSSKHLLRMINDILEFTKIETGIVELYAHQIYLADVVKEVLNSLAPLINEKKLKVSKHIDPELTTIVIDPYKLRQVLYNYLSNAVKFSNPNGEISINFTVEDANEFKLAIKDEGIGIIEQDLKKLFIAFQQLDNTLAKKYEGAGLGLALTKLIVEAQGGKVGVESEFGAGSTFYAILPRQSVKSLSESEEIK